jgi:hypothetical protein
MKRNLTKLLLLFVVMVVGVLSANAQKDVTAQYITNATLSSLDGWTNANFNDPVRGNNTAGYAVECWAGNPLSKTEYSLTQKITLPKGSYTLVSYSFYRQSWGAKDDPSKSLAYLKAGNQQVAIKTLGSIDCNGYANNQAEGANVFDSKMYRNTLNFTIETNNTEIEIGITGTHDAVASWVIVGQFELIDNGVLATPENPFDVTGYMTNPGFEYRDMTGWTLSENGAIGALDGNQPFKVGGYFAEKWQQSGALTARSMSQTINNLPAGLYKLTANVGGDGTYITFNGKTVNGSSETADLTAYSVIGSGQSLTITAGKTDAGNTNWIHFDNFRLHFCGDVAAMLTSVREKAFAILNSPVLPAAAKQALQEVYDNTENPDDYLQAINDLNDAISTAGTAIAEIKYYLYNVGTKQFLTSGNWWGTHAALDDDGMPITIEMTPEGKYRLSTTSAFSGRYVKDGYMDVAEAQDWTLERVGETNYFTLKNANNKYLYYTGTQNVADETETAPTGDSYYWQAMTKEQLIERLSTATAENPVDATFLMTNGKVRRNWPESLQGTDGWSLTHSMQVSQAYMQAVAQPTRNGTKALTTTKN